MNRQRRVRCFAGRMVVIFGFGPGKEKDLGEVAPTVCPNCHNQVFLHHVQSKKSMRLYFVPVVPYGTDDYLMCPVCSRGLQLSRAQLPHLRSMCRATAAFRAGRLPEAQYLAQAERFWRLIGVSPAGRQQSAAPARQQSAAPARQQSAAPAPPPPAAGQDEASWVAQLRQLAQLHDQGVLSDAEYETAKRRLIGTE
jgi:Short C-terminal domain/zinc-ribbon family